MKKEALIGREIIGQTFDTKKNKKLKLGSHITIDFTRKEHTMIIAKSGSGKSYLAGVIAEELIKTIDNYAVILLDPMGIFSTLSIANNGPEVEAWNSEFPDVEPKGLDNFEVWIPAGDIEHFDKDMYDKAFSLSCKDLSFSTLCFAFDMDPLEPMVNLFRKAQTNIAKQNPNYGLYSLKEYIKEHGKDLDFKEQTIEALCTRLDALQELKLITDYGSKFSEMVQRNKIVVFDLSMSSSYTARIIVNFFAEHLLSRRKVITKKLLKAQQDETKIEIEDYIPPTQLLIDEAHNFLKGNPMLEKFVKEGRNVGCMLTAISQSPDLNRHVYANIIHLFIGQLVFSDDIMVIRGMLPFEEKADEFRSEVKNLDVGCFLYYNIDRKIKKKMKVRPRETMHPASTELKDELNLIKSKQDILEEIKKLEREKEQFKEKLKINS
ncbi:MAG: ATP-binding protein [Bacteroidales bacterium]|nr:ATP-binding protein [Bacteroidales bacterium]